MEQKCPKCNSSNIVGSAIFNEQIIEYLDFARETTFKPRWKLQYNRKMMCIDCGNILETRETSNINVHQLALLCEEEKKNKRE